MVQDQQQGAPGKPFFLYFASGAMHAPHHVTQEWVDPYRGVFDQGWDAWRQGIFDRQVASGVVPAGTELTPRPEWVRAWDDQSADERRMLARQQEVFAGFLTHTDAQIGRVVSALETFGLMDNTMILVFSDNGASAEGGKDGSINEHRFTAHVRESLEENLAHYDDWGGFTTYNHYSWGWAWAGNTPHKLWKRYTWLGGTRTPLILHWPGRVAQPGTVAPPVQPRHRPPAHDHGGGRAGTARRRSTACPNRKWTAPACCRHSTTPAPPRCTTRSTSR